jgi:hypothetical protein
MAFTSARGEPQINTKRFEPPEIVDKEELKAAQKLFARDSSMPLGLSAIGVSLLMLATILGVRIRRGMQQATTFANGAGHESERSVALASTSADSILELKTQQSTIRSFGWSQQSSKDSYPTTLCYATDASDESAMPKRDFFGFRDEARVLKNTAARPGQQNYMSVLKGALGFTDAIKGDDGSRSEPATASSPPRATRDFFGFRDEARVLSNTAARPGQQNYMSVMKGAFGFVDTIKVNDGSCAIDDASPDLRTPVRDGGSPSVVVSYASADLRPAPSVALPFLDRPEVLDEVRLAGDAGFDPFSLASSKVQLLDYREAEVKHARLAMLAAVGWPLAELWDTGLAKTFGLRPIIEENSGLSPSVLNGGMGKVSPAYWVGALAFAAGVEALSEYQKSQAKAADSQWMLTGSYVPGDIGFDPLGFYTGKSESDKMLMETAEIKHGRLAMIAITVYALEEAITKTSVVQNTAFLFEPFWKLAQ